MYHNYHSATYQPEPSFYNGYTMTTIPTHYYPAQPTPAVVQNTPVATYPQTNYPAPMKTSQRVRQALFGSHHHQQQQLSNTSEDDYLYHEEQLNRNLSRNGFQRLLVKGDGNCLFYALAEGLIYEMQLDPTYFAPRLQNALHLPRNLRLADFADRLRQLCVDQWRLYEDYYSQFVVDQEKATFLKEVKKFSKNGVSDTILGDIVPLTIANALDIHITIFTSLVDLPRIDVKPERKSSSSFAPSKIIYLAYNQQGIGHYDAAYPRQ